MTAPCLVRGLWRLGFKFCVKNFEWQWTNRCGVEWDYFLLDFERNSCCNTQVHHSGVLVFLFNLWNQTKHLEGSEFPWREHTFGIWFETLFLIGIKCKHCGFKSLLAFLACLVNVKWVQPLYPVRARAPGGIWVGWSRTSVSKPHDFFFFIAC